VKISSQTFHKVNMAKTMETDSLGYTVQLNKVPTLAEGTDYGIFAEAVAAFGSAQNLLDKAVNSVVQHDMKGAIREALCENLEKHLGITRETQKVTSPTKADPNRQVDEYVVKSDAEFVKKALATANETVASTAQFVVPTEGFDFDAISEPRTAGSRGPGKTMLAFAEIVIAKGADAYNKTIGLLEASNPDAPKVVLDANGVPTTESLAGLIKANQQRMEKESMAALGIA
jgi:hypothetical protein